MLTDLSWLNTREMFPPASERERLNRCEKNRQLFEGEQAEVYKEAYKRIERVIGHWDNVVSYPVVLNYQKLMTLKIIDLLFGEPPTIHSQKDQKRVDDIVKASGGLETFAVVAMDVSRYGDGLLYIRDGAISMTQPPIWFPIVDPLDVRKKSMDVLAWTSKDILYVRIHESGYVTEQEYRIDTTVNGQIIQGKTKDSGRMSTGLKESAIIQVSNVKTSDRVTGIDDYTDIDTIIQELGVRFGQIAKILDKHAEPSMQGPESALEQDPVSGEWRFASGNYLKRGSNDDPEASYITWEGQLESNFKHIENLMSHLYALSEMGKALFGDIPAGQVPSGSALRRLLIAPLAKVTRIRMRFDAAIKKAIMLASSMKGAPIDDVTITWQDGLPGDPVEESKIITERTQKPSMSQRRALMQYDGMSEAQADEEIAVILDEEGQANGSPPQTFE